MYLQGDDALWGHRILEVGRFHLVDPCIQRKTL